MKKVTAIALIIALVINVFLGLTKTTNSIIMKVVEVDNDVVVVVDNDGNLWEFYGDGFKVNDTVNCIMDGEKIIDCA